MVRTSLHRSLRPLVVMLAALALALSASWVAAPDAEASPELLPMTFTNDSGRPETLFLYVVGVDIASGDLGSVDAEGTFTPWPPGAPEPVPAPDVSIAGPSSGDAIELRVPKGFSGRIYFSFGERIDFRLTPDGLVQPAPWNEADPNADTLLDWTEFTYVEAGLFINSSQVDMFAVPHTVGVADDDGNVESTGTVVEDGRQKVIDGMRALPAWRDTVVERDGTVLRVLSPGKAADAGRFDPNYLDAYIARAWSAYADRTLTVVPFADQPDTRFFGRTSGTQMAFTDGTGQQVATFERPSTSDVWGCDGALLAPNDRVVGPLARTLCAALVRGTLGTVDTQPSLDDDEFYANDVGRNEYGRLVHANMVDGRAYAFPFDDVGGFESLVTDGNPSAALITLDPFEGGGTPPPDNPDPDDPDDGDAVALVSDLDGRCIDVPRSNFSDGVRLNTWGCNGTDAQAWTFDGLRLRSQDGLCMDAAGAGTADGTPIQIATCSDNPAQDFVLSEAGDLVNVAADRCVDIVDGERRNGAALQLATCSGRANQKWSVG